MRSSMRSATEHSRGETRALLPDLGERILVIGRPGAGKTTFAEKLARELNVVHIALDDEYWAAGWTEPETEVWRAAQESLCARGAWLIDGNYLGDLRLRAAYATGIVICDAPRPVCAARVVKRYLKLLATPKDRLPEYMVVDGRRKVSSDWPAFVARVLCSRDFATTTLVRAVHDFRGPVLIINTWRRRRPWAQRVRYEPAAVLSSGESRRDHRRGSGYGSRT